jgi:hypothetical protein
MALWLRVDTILNFQFYGRALTFVEKIFSKFQQPYYLIFACHHKVIRLGLTATKISTKVLLTTALQNHSQITHPKDHRVV